MNQHTDTGQAAAAGELIRFGKDRSMPRALYLRSRRLFTLFRLAGFSPAVLLISGVLMPGWALVVAAGWFDDLFWSHIKQVSIAACTSQCWMMGYGLVAIPLSWLMTVFVAVAAIPLSAQNWNATNDAFRQGAAPFGRMANGQAKPPPSPGLGALVGLAMAVLSGALLLAGVYLLYHVAGIDRVIRSGREVPGTVGAIWITVIMGITQFLGATLAGVLTVAGLNLRRLVSRMTGVRHG